MRSFVNALILVASHVQAYLPTLEVAHRDVEVEYDETEYTV